jgi:hypothetical protein
MQMIANTMHGMHNIKLAYQSLSSKYDYTVQEFNCACVLQASFS